MADDEKPKHPEAPNSLSERSEKESKKEEAKPQEAKPKEEKPREEPLQGEKPREEKTQEDTGNKEDKSEGDDKKPKVASKPGEGKDKKKKKSPKKKSPKKRSNSHQQSKKKKHRSKDHRRTKEEPTSSSSKKSAVSPPDATDSCGETLAPCSEKEWEFAPPAYNAALLNVKRKPNRPTVFALKKKDGKDKSATSPKDGQIVNGLRSVSPDKIKQKKKKGQRDRADYIGRIVAGIVRKYLEGKPEDDIQVEIKLVAPDGTQTPVIP